MAKSTLRKIDETVSRYGLVPIIGTGLAAGICISPFAGTAAAICTFLPYSLYVETDAKLAREELSEYCINPENSMVVRDESGLYRVPRDYLYGFPGGVL